MLSPPSWLRSRPSWCRFPGDREAVTCQPFEQAGPELLGWESRCRRRDAACRIPEAGFIKDAVQGLADGGGAPLARAEHEPGAE